MRKIALDSLSKNVVQLINEENPLCEDIGIYDTNGDLSSVIITPDAYSYFLRKIEEDEDKQDFETVKNFDSKKEFATAKSIDDILSDGE